MLGLAGSNTVSLQPAVRIACTDEAFNVKTKHAVIKRITDPWASSEKHPKTRMYKRDDNLMARLNAATRGVLRRSPSLEATLSAVRSSFPDDAPPEDIAKALDAMRKAWQPYTTIDYPNPEGKGTNRVPVRLLSNHPEEIVTMRRKMQQGPQLRCECNAWRPKTEEEAKRDGLPWPPPELDRERYFVSLPMEDMGATWYEHDEQFRISATKQVVCNPMRCPHAGAFVPKKSGEGKPCKPETEINCQLGDWGGGELCFVHAESWATAQRFNTSLAVIFQACGGNVAGIEVDICLEYTKAQTVPGGSKTRHPYWIVAIPYGMSESEFRERAIAQKRALLADATEMERQRVATQQLLGEAQMEWRTGALLPEFQPYKMLGQGMDSAAEVGDSTVVVRHGPSGIESAVAFTDDHREAMVVLIEAYGKTEDEAQVLVMSNAEDLCGMFERLGPPPTPEPEEEDGPPALEPEMEPDDEPPAPEQDAAEGDFSAPDAEPEPEPQPAPTEPEPETEPETTPDHTPEPTPAAAAAPLFPEQPRNVTEIHHRMMDLGEGGIFVAMLQGAWEDVTGTPRMMPPSPAACKSPEEQAAVELAVWTRVEDWWRTEGCAKHGAA